MYVYLTNTDISHNHKKQNMPYLFLTSLNLSTTALSAPPVARLTTTITTIATINAGRSSYISNIPRGNAWLNF